MSQRAEPEAQPAELSRRAVLRAGVVTAGMAAWSTPAVTSWVISSAHAGSPMPEDPADPGDGTGTGTPAPGTDPATATPDPPEALARTGAPLVPLALGGAAAIGLGTAALRHRHHPDDDAAHRPPPLPRPPSDER